MKIIVENPNKTETGPNVVIGRPPYVRVFTGLNNEQEIDPSNICAVDISIRPDAIVRANLIMYLAELNVQDMCAVWKIIHPLTGELKEIKSIQFADGTEFSVEEQIK